MKVLIVGMGFGNLYKSVYEKLGAEIVTVDTDPSKGQYSNLMDALATVSDKFDATHICVPNHLHEMIAYTVAPYSRIVFIEKPGVSSAKNWLKMVTTYPETRFMMTKNNMWRDNISEMRWLVDSAVSVKLNWINKNRVPNPGTWFTTKELAFGGVSRDLMPHLLSLYIALSDQWLSSPKPIIEIEQLNKLADVIDTDYGVVNPNGKYDVDDYCKVRFQNGLDWSLTADWKSDDVDDRSITFELFNGEKVSFELGLCPEEAYQAMVCDALENIDNDRWWAVQCKQDVWIHQLLERL